MPAAGREGHATDFQLDAIAKISEECKKLVQTFRNHQWGRSTEGAAKRRAALKKFEDQKKALKTKQASAEKPKSSNK